ncbi:MAG: ribonuclease H family protein [Paludibacteraceae bacterium]|nr:ribonuclease H family protein [Paludibacteraceae bacterium]
MSNQKQKFYVVWQGKQTGVFTSWADCEAQVKGVEGAKYKSFPTRAEAEAALAGEPPVWRKKGDAQTANTQLSNCLLSNRQITTPALAVDAACSGNPGMMEFRGVTVSLSTLNPQPSTLQTTEVFHRGPFAEGTNNIGEFLAIVLGLAYLKQHNLPWVLYSDSRTALAWLQKKHAQTKLECTPANQPLFEMLRKAEQWLHDNTYTTTVLKWDTDHWGEIPADFGRK